MAGALLPILYHLIRRIRARKVKFSSLLFLKATPKELIKKRRLRDLILLIVRSCILGLLAFAFARPFFPEKQLPFTSAPQNKSVVILIDNSYSMQYENAFEKAVGEANKILDNAAPLDEFAVVLFSDHTELLTGLSGDVELHRSVIKNLGEVSNHPTDFYTALTYAEELLKDAKNEKREVVLISDMQNYAWSSKFENWKLKPSITFKQVSVAPKRSNNTYVAQFSQTISRKGESAAAEYIAQVAFMKKESNREYPVELWSNGKLVGKNNAEFLQSNRVIFQQTELMQGSYQGYVAVSPDKLPVDDKYFFSFAIEERPSILCIDNVPVSQLGSAFYLKSAFDFGERSDYQFVLGKLEDITRAKLVPYKLVFLTNISGLSNQQITSLAGYVENGGAVVLSFGDRTSIPQLEPVLKVWRLGIPKEITTIKSLQEAAIINEFDEHHPIFSVFVKTGAGDIYRPKFSTYVKIVPDTATAVVAKLSNGDPLLIERKSGAGMFLIFTSSLDKEWTDFPLTEIFVPLVYQIAKYAGLTAKKQLNFSVGEPIVLEGKPNDEWEVSAPGDKLFRVKIDAQGAGYFRESNAPGNYIAAHGKEKVIFSVNVDTRESDLTYRDQEEVFATVSKPTTESDESFKKAYAATLELQERRQKVWRYLIFFILAFFLFETIYANRYLNVRIL